VAERLLALLVFRLLIDYNTIPFLLVINSQLFEAHLHDHGTEIRQCFKCGQWGHTQAACGAQARCMVCAGNHQTCDCPRERTSCLNCGHAHKAWQRAVCRTFKSFLEKIQARKAALQARTASIRHGASASPAGRQIEEFTFVAPRKRAREPSPHARHPEVRRPVGRPTNAAVAARQAERDRSQSRITILDGRASAQPPATPISSRDDPSGEPMPDT
jgi:hypothetical protein